MKNVISCRSCNYTQFLKLILSFLWISILVACGGNSAQPIDPPSAVVPPIEKLPPIIVPPGGTPPVVTPPIVTPPIAVAPNPILPAYVTVDINNVSRSLQRIEQLTTRSGNWQIDDLGEVGDAHAYLWRLQQNPDFLRVMICRRIFTIEAGDSDVLSLLSFPVKIVTSTFTLNWNLTVAQGACRVMQNIEPVSPHAEWIKEAVTQKRLPSYDRHQAWLPDKLTLLTPDMRRKAYDPSSLGPWLDSTAIPIGSANYVGVTTSQGGEYDSSRGFIHDADARIIDAALNNEDTRISNTWSEFTQYTFYSLAQPQGARWSFTNHITSDPQFPQSGDRPWESPIWIRPNTNIDSMTEVKDWGRDVAHLENTGFIHWIATEDPIAGLVVQRQTAYALASFYENYRTNLSTYHGNIDQERGIFNTLSSLWKSSDVALRVASQNGKIIWPVTLTNKQANEIIANYDAVAQPVLTATIANAPNYDLRLAGSIFGGADYQSYLMADASKPLLTSISAFIPVQYGKEPMWLWSKSGNVTVRKWFEAYTRGLVLRMTVIGGAKGVDRMASERGSGFPIGPITLDNWGNPIASIPPFSSDTGWAEWTLTLPLQDVASRTTFDGASIHTATQMQGALLYAKDLNLNVLDLDKAISSVSIAKAATASLRYPNLQMHKHLGGP
jgi:hypothetical protein